MSSITFRKPLHALLFSHELKNQISHGFWEEQIPMDHWEWLSNLKINISQVPKVEGFQTKIRYNFGNKDLFSMIKERCLKYIRLFLYFPNTDWNNDIIRYGNKRRIFSHISKKNDSNVASQ